MADDPEAKEEKIRVLDEDDIALLKTYGLGPYANKIKDVEKDLKDVSARVNDICGIKESDTGLAAPSRWDLVSDKQAMQEEQPLQVGLETSQFVCTSCCLQYAYTCLLCMPEGDCACNTNERLAFTFQPFSEQSYAQVSSRGTTSAHENRRSFMQVILQVARCTKIINPGTDEAKYVINVKQIAKVHGCYIENALQDKIVIHCADFTAVCGGPGRQGGTN